MKLSELKNGAIVEMKNGERYIKVDNTFIGWLEDLGYMPIDEYDENLKMKCRDGLADGYDIIKVNNDVKHDNGCLSKAGYLVDRDIWTWIRETKPILTKKEREYLKAVCKPFDVIHVEKFRVELGYEFIIVEVDGGSMKLPPFEKGKMYKGMSLGKKYSAEELEIK